MGPVPIIAIGLLPAQLAGAWTYLKLHESDSIQLRREWIAASASGFATALVASLIYLALGLHKQLEPTMSWGASVFFGVCFGICQGALFRGRPLRRGPPTDPDDFWPPPMEGG